MTRLKTVACIVALVLGAAGCSAKDALDLSSTADGANPTTPGAVTGQTLPPPTTAGSTTSTDQSMVGAQTSQTAPPQAGQMAAVAQNARIQFAPAIGASAETVQPLSNRLSARAVERGLTLAPQAESATHVLKGYFSTISDEKGTTVIFVWDVLDQAGNRLHRIQGQEKASGTGEGWTAVTGANINAIANRTIDELATWLQGGQVRT